MGPNLNLSVTSAGAVTALERLTAAAAALAPALLAVKAAGGGGLNLTQNITQDGAQASQALATALGRIEALLTTHIARMEAMEKESLVKRRATKKAAEASALKDTEAALVAQVTASQLAYGKLTAMPMKSLVTGVTGTPVQGAIAGSLAGAAGLLGENQMLRAYEADLVAYHLKEAKKTSDLAKQAEGRVALNALGENQMLREYEKDLVAHRLKEAKKTSDLAKQAEERALLNAWGENQMLRAYEVDLVAYRALQAKKAAAALEGGAVAAASSGGYGRSLTRGVAGSAGLNMLTYGASIPAVVVGFGAAATVGASVKQGSEFQYQTAFSGALGQMKPDDLKSMRGELMAMGTDSIYGPVELAKGMRVLEQAGVGASDAMKILPISMRVALQGETDLTKASETLVGVMRQFKLEYKDVPAIGDAISKTAAVTQANIPSLMEALKAATGLSRYGVDLNTTLASIGMLAKQGVVGGQAGTFFRRFVEDLYTPKSDGARRAMREMDFRTDDGKGGLKPYREVQEDFVSKMQKYDPQSQIAMMGQILDIRAAKQGAALVTDMASEFKKLRADIDNSKGSLDEFWKAMSGETKLLWEQTKSNFSGLMISTFSGMEGPLNSLLGSMRDLFKDPATLEFLKLMMMVPQGYAGLIGLLGKGTSSEDRQALAFKENEAFISRKVAQGTNPDGNSIDSTALKAAYEFRREAGAARARERALKSAAEQTPGMAAEIAKLQAKAGVMSGESVASEPKKRASNRILDPLGVKEADAKARLDDEADAMRVRNKMSLTEQVSTHEMALLESRHRNGLVSEKEYSLALTAIEEERLKRSRENSQEEISRIRARIPGITDVTTKGRELLRLEQMVAAQRLADQKAADRADEKRADAANKAVKATTEAEKLRAGIEADFAGIRTRRETALATQRMQMENRVRPAEVALGYQAEQDAHTKAQAERLKLEKSIAEQSKLGKDADKEKLAVYQAELEKLPELEEYLKRINKESALGLFARSREASFGIESAMQEYSDAVGDNAAHARDLFNKSVNGMSDNLTNFVMKGKTDFKGLAVSIINDMVRMQIQANVTKPLAAVGSSLLSRLLNPSVVDMGGISGGSAWTPTALGNVFNSPSVSALSGGIYNSPTFFKFAQGGVLGEAGPEAVMPLKRGSDGKLGVAGGGVPNVIINITNAAGTPVAAKQTGPAQFDGENYIVGVVLSAVENNPRVRSVLAGALR